MAEVLEAGAIKIVHFECLCELFLFLFSQGAKLSTSASLASSVFIPIFVQIFEDGG